MIVGIEVQKVIARAINVGGEGPVQPAGKTPAAQTAIVDGMQDGGPALGGPARISPTLLAQARGVPLTRVRLKGSVAEILLPVGERGPQAAFAEYLDRLEHKAIFPEAREALAALRGAEVIASEPVPAGAPVVAVVTSTLEHLVPGGVSHDAQATARVAALLREGGCLPLIIPPCADVMLPSERGARAAGVVAMTLGLDGVVGLGGADVHPRIYHDTNRFARDPNYPRDRFEADFALAAMEQELFLLGICRSHQLWNAAAHDEARRDASGRPAGTLVQDVREEGYSATTQNQEQVGLDEQKPFVLRDPRGRVLFENRVVLAPDSRMARALDRRRSWLTNSYHHQAVKTPGVGFRVVGAVRDPVTGKDTIEATERWNAFTTQFHPEVGAAYSAVDRQLFFSVARRARIFRLRKELRAAGRDGVAELLAAMRALPPGPFHASDFAWVREDLVRHWR